MSTTNPKPVVLAILDGWGLAPKNRGNAIMLAKTPVMDSLMQTALHTELQASGESVGLPKGEDGNTETGHLNIGAGQIVYQDLPRINQAIADGSFVHNQQFLAAIEHIKKNHSTLHLLGLVGSGGVHSHLDHLYALLHTCKKWDVPDVALHVITDGRDSPPTSGVNFIHQIQRRLADLKIGHIATICGRYYAMDRDHRWERTEIAYKALTQSSGTKVSNPEEGITACYAKGETDEFIKPLIITNPNGAPVATIKDNDAVIFFNFRIDRPRQLTKVFVYPNFEYISVKQDGFDPYAIKYYKSHLVTSPVVKDNRAPFDRGALLKNLYFVTMTEYENGLPCHVAFPPEHIETPLGKVIADVGLRQLRMSETEKERFVTFYFNGQREDPYPGEDRIIIPSPPVSTYDQKPEMSSIELTQTLIERVNTNLYDFIVVNFANPDMVGHTGNLEAGIKACEYADQNIGKIIEAVDKYNGVVIVTADHGNVEEMINLTTGGIDTEHSTNPVPLIVHGHQFASLPHNLPRGILADVAPTILKIMGIKKPDTMSGQSLI
jgi:2,3-bisphosphoglycerate-independent phosphoglycerate mutase